MEANDNNKNNLKYNAITEYLEKMCEEDDKFKERLEEMIDIAQKNYEEINIFLKENQNVISKGKLKFGCELLKKNQLIIQKILSIFDPNELDIIQLFEQHKKIIDDNIIKIKELKEKEKETLKEELASLHEKIKEINYKIERTKYRLNGLKSHKKDIKKDKRKQKKDNILEKNSLNSYENNNSIQDNEDSLNKINNESYINENIINLEEFDDKIKESNKSKEDSDNKEIYYLKEEINYLTEQFFSLRNEEYETFQKLKNLNNQIFELKKENPLYKLEKYDKLVIIYLNKIYILNNFIKRASTKIYTIMLKRPKFK